MFGALGAIAALAQRDRAGAGTGRGMEVQSALFENNVFLVAQHMMQFAVTGKPAAPMASRIAAWAVYDVFSVRDGEQIFLGVVSDTQWGLFCDAFGYADLKEDARLTSNNDRVKAREWLLPILRERLAPLAAAEIAAKFEAAGLPYAPISKPHELFDDPHLVETGGLAKTNVPTDASGARRSIETTTPLLPLTLNGQRLGLRASPPSLGESTAAILSELGYSRDEQARLAADGVVVMGDDCLD